MSFVGQPLSVGAPLQERRMVGNPGEDVLYILPVCPFVRDALRNGLLPVYSADCQWAAEYHCLLGLGFSFVFGQCRRCGRNLFQGLLLQQNGGVLGCRTGRCLERSAICAVPLSGALYAVGAFGDSHTTILYAAFGGRDLQFGFRKVAEPVADRYRSHRMESYFVFMGIGRVKNGDWIKLLKK